jgi:hypothetical protein
MGVLKHIVLPILSLYHIYVCGVVIVYGKEAYLPLLGLDLPSTSTTSTSRFRLGALESHLIGLLLGAHVMCLMNNVASMVQENSHYRGMAVMMQEVWFVLQWCDAYAMGWMQRIPAILATIATMGLVIHANEPGLFTKDKFKES